MRSNVFISLRLDPITARDVDVICRATGVNRSALVRRAIREKVARDRAKLRQRQPVQLTEERALHPEEEVTCQRLLL